jgi:hypothetical protein
MSLQSLEEGLIRELAATMQMVQVICITIDGVKVMCLGPVLHVPPAGLFVGDVQEIEFGELVPGHLAARLLDGEYSKSMGVQ